jgi:hypothetical protein
MIPEKIDLIPALNLLPGISGSENDLPKWIADEWIIFITSVILSAFMTDV